MQAKIYISSTFSDLEAYREKVYRALRKVQHDVIAMEDYVAADKRPLEQCLEDVRRSDLYIGIFAWRYGFVPKTLNPGKRSITELMPTSILNSATPRTRKSVCRFANPAATGRWWAPTV
jgi:hypothetical protein